MIKSYINLCPNCNSFFIHTMKNLLFVLAIAGLMTLASCKKSEGGEGPTTDTTAVAPEAAAPVDTAAAAAADTAAKAPAAEEPKKEEKKAH